MATIGGIVALDSVDIGSPDDFLYLNGGKTVVVRGSGPGYSFAVASANQSLDRPFLVERGTLTICGQIRCRDVTSSIEAILDGWSDTGPAIIQQVQSDFALAVWDADQRVLVLARAPLSSFSLAYRPRGTSLAFATLAPRLGTACGPNLDGMARQMSGKPLFGSAETAFRNIFLVEPGTIVEWRDGRIIRRRFWRARPRPAASDREAALRLRHALDAAVSDALPGPDTLVSAHLSAGRDSAVVAVSAARHFEEQGRRLDAFTAVPNASVGVASGTQCFDEGPGASRAIAGLANVDHHLVMTERFSLGKALDRVNRFLPGPYGSPVNLSWWSRIGELASERGAKLILTGSAGNLTVSAGGPWAIPDLLRQGDFSGWARAMLSASQAKGAGWANLLYNSLGSFAAAPVDRLLRRLAGRSARGNQARFVRGDLRTLICSDALKRDDRPPRNWRGDLYDALDRYDGADPGNELAFGVRFRDPTADRRVVEAVMCFSSRQLASRYDRRPIFEMVFDDRLPPAILRSEVRGIQAADWSTAIDPDELKDSVRRYAVSSTVRAIVDVPAVLNAIDRWPTGEAIDPDVADEYVNELLPAISLASFAHLHWP